MHLFRTEFELGPDAVMLVQATYCPDERRIEAVAIHPVLRGVVGPLLMTQEALDSSALERLHGMIFSPSRA